MAFNISVSDKNGGGKCSSSLFHLIYFAFVWAAVTPERADTSRDAQILSPRGFSRDPRRRLVDFSDAILESKSRKTNRVRAERVRLDHVRARPNVFFMNGADAVRLAYAKFFQAMINRHSAIKQQRPHRAIAANNTLLKLGQQIHRDFD
jgi:hypothetical protein